MLLSGMSSPDESQLNVAPVMFVFVEVCIATLLWEPRARRFHVAACHRTRSRSRGPSRFNVI